MKLLSTDEAFDLDTIWVPLYLTYTYKDPNPGGNIYIPRKDYERFEQNCVKGRNTIFRKGIDEPVLKEIHQRRREYYRNKINEKV